uniref:Uncharacterized protein n=1 Tax=Pseudodiaptomus poplesia TaxID=213370 RepID=A0A1S6GLS8_9MAXI|nr:hypothetical protein [Pseudodiaptomus poplesia]AQS22807.1 hypothetical protein [Pseudodiaptomus poplesia]AQS22819.1 hypothetical protein [Pseudodiaptomus poplesia]
MGVTYLVPILLVVLLSFLTDTRAKSYIMETDDIAEQPQNKPTNDRTLTHDMKRLFKNPEGVSDYTNSEEDDKIRGVKITVSCNGKVKTYTSPMSADVFNRDNCEILSIGDGDF